MHLHIYADFDHALYIETSYQRMSQLTEHIQHFNCQDLL